MHELSHVKSDYKQELTDHESVQVTKSIMCAAKSQTNNRIIFLTEGQMLIYPATGLLLSLTSNMHAEA